MLEMEFFFWQNPSPRKRQKKCQIKGPFLFSVFKINLLIYSSIYLFIYSSFKYQPGHVKRFQFRISNGRIKNCTKALIISFFFKRFWGINDYKNPKLTSALVFPKLLAMAGVLSLRSSEKQCQSGSSVCHNAASSLLVTFPLPPGQSCVLVAGRQEANCWLTCRATSSASEGSWTEPWMNHALQCIPCGRDGSDRNGLSLSS